VTKNIIFGKRTFYKFDVIITPNLSQAGGIMNKVIDTLTSILSLSEGEEVKLPS